jgi:hypothetical protein
MIFFLINGYLVGGFWVVLPCFKFLTDSHEVTVSLETFL